MAYVAKGNYGYGDGLNSDIENPAGQINSYANVTAYNADTITIGAASNGIYEKFAAGSEIMIHVSATNGTSQEYAYLGRYIIAKIISVAGSVLTIDTDFTKILPVGVFSTYQVQAITIAKFKNLTLSTTTITTPTYSVTNKYGGILLIKCKEQLSFSGGNLNLLDKGIPVANGGYRPVTLQESKTNVDTDKYAGFENHITINNFLLNCGDGACMIWAKKFVQYTATSRIGGSVAGAHFKRGNVGGSTIAIIADDIQDFDPAIISKIKGTGKGIGRCYIASNTKLRNDEGLYAYDCISDPTRVMQKFNIKKYGDGSLGNVTNPTAPMNNYAKVVSVSQDGKIITYSNKTVDGMAKITQGSLVMFHVSKHTNEQNMKQLGKFTLSKVLSDNGNTLILETAISKTIDTTQLANYNCQIISIAQFDKLTINTDYNKTTAWNDTTKTGGICAIAIKTLANLENGKINVEGKGGGSTFGYEGLAFIGNAQMADILPLGSGHGTIFFLANEAIGNENTRIGATYDGSNFGGDGGGVSDNYGKGGGLSGNNGYARRTNGAASNVLASGSVAGKHSGCLKHSGATIMIIANKLISISLKNVSTGGKGGVSDGLPGGSGFGGGQDSSHGYSDYTNVHTYVTGGGGGYIGGGGIANALTSGGASGCCFIYVNEVVNFDKTGVVAA